MPSCEPRPVPTSSAVGVASPSAQGHAMMSVATAAVKASSIEPSISSQPTSVSSDSTKTIGTNTPDTRSARRCTSALPVWASSTRRAMRASSVSAPTREASTTIRPPTLMVPPTTRLSSSTSTGTLSPVSSEASTDEVPSTTTPSVAMVSPGRTTKRSLGCSAETGTRTSTPSRSTAASRAARVSSASRASRDERLARASR